MRKAKSPGARGVMERGARLIAVAILIGVVLSQVAYYILQFDPIDTLSYSWAGEAWRTTGNPYSEAPFRVGDHPIYRYAPWFAVPWVALSVLPYEILGLGWASLMVGCAFLAVVPLFRAHGMRAIPFGGFILGWLIAIGLNGNVQPAMMALLAWGVERRWGPAAIALCASLKAVPILYAVVYAGRGEWRKVAATLLMTGLLVAPMLLFEIPAISTEAGVTWSLYSTSVVLWGGVALAATVAGFLLARTRYAWLFAGAAVALALPRAFFYDITFILPGIAESPPAPSGRPRDSRGGIERPVHSRR